MFLCEEGKDKIFLKVNNAGLSYLMRITREDKLVRKKKTRRYFGKNF